MKTFITLIGFAITFSSFGQRSDVVALKQAPHKHQIRKMEMVETNVVRPIFGNYLVSSYYVLGKDSPKGAVMERIVGSEIKLGPVLVSGTEIESDSIDIYEIEKMSRGDYIYRNFGRGIRAPEPDIPSTLNVYKTGNLDCYGIALLRGTRIGLPYKGTLLILERIK